MFLYDCFLGLNESILTRDFQGVLLQRPDWELAKRKVVASYRCLSNPSKIAAYDAFLLCCEQALKGRNETPLLDVVITYLAESEALVDQEACQKLIQLFHRCFEHQHKPEKIASMGICFVDRPRAFVSFICYLLQREVSVEDILSRHLLQDYFRYYLSTLNQSNNALQKTYHLLSLFDEAKSLVKVAKVVCCDERGFAAYALDGSLQLDETQMVQFERIDARPWFTSNEQNLKSLHAVFHEDFLLESLYQSTSRGDDGVWMQALSDVFNHPNTVQLQLPAIVNRLHEHPMLPKLLANLLNESSLSLLVNNHVVGVFNLTPFCPILIQMMRVHDLPIYLQTLRQQNSSGPALFSSLFSLFNCIKYNNLEIDSLLFDALLGAIDMEPCILEDMRIIGKLRKLTQIDAWINKKARGLETEFDCIIRSQTQGAIEEVDYISVYDAWANTTLKLRHMKEILPFETSFPMDKYMLYVNIARSFIQYHEPSEFDLVAFATAFRIEPVFKADSITEFERLIAEMLSLIDEDNVRASCVRSLDENAGHPWRMFNYGGQCFFKKAAQSGNLGLMQWMSTQHIKREFTHDTLAKIAAYEYHWHIVSYLLMQHSLKQPTVNFLFETALQQGRLSAIPELMNGEYPMPDLSVMLSQFKTAIHKNDINGIRCLLTGSVKLPEKAMERAFYIAIEHKYFELAIVLAESYCGAMMRRLIAHTLSAAIRLNQCDVIDALKPFIIKHSNQNIIDNAFIQAARLGHIDLVKQLMGFSKKPFNLTVIQTAKDEANKKEHLNIVSYLIRVSDTIDLSAADWGNDLGVNEPIKKSASQGFFQLKTHQKSKPSQELSAWAYHPG